MGYRFFRCPKCLKGTAQEGLVDVGEHRIVGLVGECSLGYCDDFTLHCENCGHEGVDDTFVTLPEVTG